MSAPGRSGRPTGAGRRVLTSGFGHGVAITPLHLANAYAALVNGGIWRPATLMRVAPGRAQPGRRVYSPETSYRIRQLLRLVVTNGTGRRAEAAGYPRRRQDRHRGESRRRAAISRRVERFHLRRGFSDGRSALCGAGHDRRSPPDRSQQLRHHRRLYGRAGRLARDLAHRAVARRDPQRDPRHRHRRS